MRANNLFLSNLKSNKGFSVFNSNLTNKTNIIILNINIIGPKLSFKKLTPVVNKNIPIKDNIVPILSITISSLYSIS